MVEETMKNDNYPDPPITMVMENKAEGYNEAQEQIKRLKEEKKKLKKQLFNKEDDLLNLQKLLEESENSKKLNYIPLKEARKITYKALRKGSAAQNLINIIENNSINYKLKKKAINQLMLNAFGVIHNTKNTAIPDILKYTDSHLKLFRQEQLILLAENERLAQKMKELRKQVLDNKIDNLKKTEMNYIVPMKNTNVDKNLNTVQKEKDDGYIELDADVVENKLKILIKNIQIAQYKLVCFAFRKLTNNVCYKMDMGDVKTKIGVIQYKHGIKMLHNIVKKKFTNNVGSIFYKLLYINNKMMNPMNNVPNYSERNRGESDERVYNYSNASTRGNYGGNRIGRQKYETQLKDVHRDNRHHYGENNMDDEYIKNNYVNDKRKNKAMPYFVHKPYYYNSLPSANVESQKTTTHPPKDNINYIDNYSQNNKQNCYNYTSVYDPENAFEYLKKDIHKNMNAFNAPPYDFAGFPKRMNFDMNEKLDEKLFANASKRNSNNNNSRNNNLENKQNFGFDGLDNMNYFNNAYEREQLYMDMFMAEKK